MVSRISNTADSRSRQDEIRTQEILGAKSPIPKKGDGYFLLVEDEYSPSEWEFLSTNNHTQHIKGIDCRKIRYEVKSTEVDLTAKGKSVTLNQVRPLSYCHVVVRIPYKWKLQGQYLVLPHHTIVRIACRKTSGQHHNTQLDEIAIPLSSISSLLSKIENEGWCICDTNDLKGCLCGVDIESLKDKEVQRICREGLIKTEEHHRSINRLCASLDKPSQIGED